MSASRGRCVGLVPGACWPATRRTRAVAAAVLMKRSPIIVRKNRRKFPKEVFVQSQCRVVIMRLLVCRYCARSSATSWPAPSSPLDVVVRTKTDSGLRGAARARGQQHQPPPHLQADPRQRGEAQHRGLRLKYLIYSTECYKFVQYLVSKAVSVIDPYLR